MKKMLYITNIPTPYRNYRFNCMVEFFSEAGIELEVLFMNASEPDRNWALNTEAMRYKYRIFSHRQVGQALGMWLHTSFGLQRYLLKTDYDVAVLGGLASPAHFMASLLLKKSRVNILSIESNLASISNKGGLATRVKQFLMRRFKYFQVTGNRSVEFIQHYVPQLKTENIVTLPNVIDEGVFLNASIDNVEQSTQDFIASQKALGNRIVLIPARLIEVKGLLPFLQCVEPDDKMCIVIAGEGNLRAPIEQLINDKQLNVKLLGEVNQEQVAGLMKLTEFMALPSRSDASPLSVIEAISCGIPLLVSRNIGNVDDVLEEKANGWSFEYNNHQSTRQAIESLLAVSDGDYKEMQVAARDIFQRKFATDVVLKHYLKTIEGFLD